MTASPPSEEPALALAERALALVDGEAQVTVTRERSLVSRFARSRPTQATQVDARTVEVLCVVDGHTAAATTNRTDEDALREAARRAASAAAAAARSAPGSYPGLPQPTTPRAHEGFDPVTARLEPDTAAQSLRAAFAVAAQHGQEAFGIWTAGSVETAIASSTGLRASDRVTDAFAKGTFMRSRLAITSMLALGVLMTSSGAALGVSALSTTPSASFAQYGTSVPVDNPDGEVLGDVAEGGEQPPTLGGDDPDSGVLGDVAEGGDDGEGGEDGDVAGTSAGGGNDDPPVAAAQASRQLESDGRAELPFTGYAAVPTLLIGIGLLAMGLILRRNPGRASAQS